MEALIASTLTVAVAEIGDKTQLLALLLAARFKNKTAIISGILVATLLNHFAAAWLGQWAMGWLSADIGRYLVAGSFFAIALWVLVPDKVDAEESRFYRYGPFVATCLLFFIAEMGDKTQVATVMLAAQYPHFILVVIGTTLGMLLANVPVVLAGNFAAERLPLTLIRRLAACAFAALAVYAGYQAMKLSGLT